jgi:hypothetical protein
MLLSPTCGTAGKPSCSSGHLPAPAATLSSVNSGIPAPSETEADVLRHMRGKHRALVVLITIRRDHGRTFPFASADAKYQLLLATDIWRGPPASLGGASTVRSGCSVAFSLPWQRCRGECFHPAMAPRDYRFSTSRARFAGMCGTRRNRPIAALCTSAIRASRQYNGPQRQQGSAPVNPQMQPIHPH